MIMCKETEREDENWDLVAAGDKVREVCVVYVHNGIKYLGKDLDPKTRERETRKDEGIDGIRVVGFRVLTNVRWSSDDGGLSWRPVDHARGRSCSHLRRRGI